MIDCWKSKEELSR